MRRTMIMIMNPSAAGGTGALGAVAACEGNALYYALHLLKPVPEIDIWAEQNIIGIPVFNCLEISRTVCAYRPIAKAN